MEANALTPRALFDGTVSYEVPPFQRPYVGRRKTNGNRSGTTW